MTPDTAIPTPSRPRGLLAIISLAWLVGVAALVLSIQNAVGLDKQAERRNADRIAADLASCERGNLARQQIRTLGHALIDYTDGTLDAALAAGTPPAEYLEELNRRLAPVRKTATEALTGLTDVDCQAVVPGA